MTGRERKAVNRNFFNPYVWKSALAGAGVIAPLQESSRSGSRVWEPSREHALLSATCPEPGTRVIKLPNGELRCRRSDLDAW
ncbi:hypothetical protein GCM10010207_73300 [Streptomyces atratus]|nr:hypothetical protein GCM10010207_73300 [Streptomyces atratus]